MIACGPGKLAFNAVQKDQQASQQYWRTASPSLRSAELGADRGALRIARSRGNERGCWAALAAIWGDVPTQRCTVHKHRNPLANAPERLHDEITADYTDMIYADTPQQVEKRRKAFLRKWRLRHGAVANSLEEAGDRLFTFTTLPPSQWKSARTTNAIERLHEEFKRRIKTQTVLPSANTAAMLFWALLASGQIIMRKLDGWQTLPQKPSAQIIDVAA
jgi:putative transposase